MTDYLWRTLEVSQNIIDKAWTAIVEYLADNGGMWPEDHWIELGDDYDLNIFMGVYNRKADIYLVVDGKTKTDRWYELYDSSGKDY